jgi:hypothetical protein
MALVCSRCRRTNPSNAVYCYFDGFALGGAAAAAAPPAATMAAEFVFPSGRRCRTIDELVQACHDEWDGAREALRRGDLGRHLERIHRLDLSAAAQEAQGQADPDIALLNFLGALPPLQNKDRPRLGLDPRRVTATIKAGDKKSFKILIVNQGKGLLQGKARVAEGSQWLKTPDAENGDLPVRAQRNQEVSIGIDSNGLAAGQTFTGKLTVVTNGGIAELPIKLNVVAQPFPTKPFQGAGTQRKLAEQMRTAPKAAVPLLESGEVRKWFAVNGWTYPVPGDTAKGVGAVQQFFECLGLSKPPPLALSENQLAFSCRNPGVLPGEVVLRQVLPVKVNCPKCRTPNDVGTPKCASCSQKLPDPRKWVYAQTESDVPWLRVLTPSVTGPQQATIKFEVDADQLTENRIFQATLQVRANAGQRLTLPVVADARRPRETPLLVLLRPIMVGALFALVLRMAAALPADVFARWMGPELASKNHGELARWLVPPPSPPLPDAPTPPPPPSPGSLKSWQAVPGRSDGYLKMFVLATWWLGAVVGFQLVRQRGGTTGDLFSGAVAGAGAGLAVCATFGCLLIVLDAPPRWALLALGSLDPPHFVATGLWLSVVAIWWTALGAGVGLLLGVLGRRGLGMLAMLTTPVSGACRMFGLTKAAAFFACRS